MAKNSCVQRLPGDTFIVIRASYLVLCAGNATAAALIHLFESWHNIKVAARANFIADKKHKEPPSLHQWHTTKMLEDALLGIGKKHSIQEARKMLCELGIISEHKNPDPLYGFDSTRHFLFHPDRMNELLDRGRLAPSSNGRGLNSDDDTLVDECDQCGGRNHPPSETVLVDEIIQPIPNDTNNDTGKETFPAQVRGAKKSTIKKQEKKDAAPRPHWQMLVNTWFAFYQDKTGEDPTFNGRTPKQFGELVDMLQQRARKKGHEWTENHAIGSLKFFLTLAYSEPWLSKHFLIGNLVEQFDAIFARELVRHQSEKPRTPAATGFTEDMKYIAERYAEGNMDMQLVTPDLYDKMTSRNYLKIGSMNNFKAETMDERKRLAVIDWLDTYKTLKHKT